jgi:branched-chain amino acid transport system ATP-binding protein
MTSTTASADDLLHTQQLSIGYNSIPVVHDLDIQVRRGEVVALLGPNGAGKTTTLLGISGHLRPMLGTVWWQGRPSTSPLHRRCRQGMAFVTEERSVFSTLTTADNLRLGRGGIAGALAFAPELAALLNRKAGLLSGGEQQILTLARALAAKPALLLADELSLGLAPLVVVRLMRAIREAADEGIGVLLVEQQIRQALAVADRVYVLRRGRVGMSGRTSEIRQRLSEVEESYLSVVAPPTPVETTNGVSAREPQGP